MQSPRPTNLATINEDGVLVRIVKDEREPYGDIKISLNEAGLDKFYGSSKSIPATGSKSCTMGFRRTRSRVS